MERESLLATLIVLLGGLALQLFAVWPGRIKHGSASRRLERLHWLALWWPTAPALTVAAWLCGWALSQPDPVPAHVGRLIFIGAVPFAVVGGRALVRAVWSAVWSSCHSSQIYGIVTVGLLRPRIVVAPQLAKTLDEHALRAALAHERTHVRHRDPLRIWLAQFVTDLQWPWVPAQRRFKGWLATLECARDDEARATGIEGADLAAAVLGSLRFQLGVSAVATLIGQPGAVPARIARLLRPVSESPPDHEQLFVVVAGSLAMTWFAAVVLGRFCGERLINSLLAMSS